MMRVALAFLLCCLCFPTFAQTAKGEQNRFDVLEFAVDGNTVLPNVVIEKAVYPFLGPNRSLQDVEDARTRLEKAYHDAGYLTVLVDIPEQKVAEGLVRLRVVEGSVEKLKVTGAQYFLPSQMRANTPSFAPGNVPQFNEVQQELAQLSRSPDRQINPLLRAGKAPGKVEVELQVDDKLPLHGSLELNTKQSPGTVKGRLEAALRYDNLWQLQHSLSLNYITAPEDRNQVQVMVANYTLPVDRETGSALALYGIASKSNVPTILNDQLLGNGTGLGLRYIRPLPGVEGWAHSISTGIDYKDFSENSQARKRIIRYLPLAIQYNASAPDASGQWQFSLGASIGLRGFAERVVDCDGVRLDQFECKRAGASANFVAVRSEISRQQSLGGGWLLRGKLEAQFADQPLISNEQFAAGGYDSVRGYLEGERLGDKGYVARLEVETPQLLGDSWAQLNLLAFYDYGALRLVDPLPGQRDRFTLNSTGLGLKFKAGKHLNFLAYAAHALRDGAARSTGTGLNTASGETRIQAKLVAEF